MTISIRPTLPADAPLLPAIEQSAGELFRTVPELAWIADGDNIPPRRHLELIASGTCWVAEMQDGSLAGFLAAQQAGDALHIWELSVRQDQQRKGTGRALIAQAAAFAREQGLQALTLSTFRSVAWNQPMYLRLGFTVLSPEDCDERLRGILCREIAAGLPGERRCAMRLHLSRGRCRVISVRRAGPADHARVVEIWRTAVDATHGFLSAADRDAIDREVQRWLPDPPLWLAVDEHDTPVAFMQIVDAAMEALFVDAVHHRRGIGRALVEHALALSPAPILTTTVNEQNAQAVGFYERLGFRRTGRAETDEQGRCYPLLFLRLEAPDRPVAEAGPLAAQPRAQ